MKPSLVGMRWEGRGEEGWETGGRVRAREEREGKDCEGRGGCEGKPGGGRDMSTQGNTSVGLLLCWGLQGPSDCVSQSLRITMDCVSQSLVGKKDCVSESLVVKDCVSQSLAPTRDRVSLPTNFPFSRDFRYCPRGSGCSSNNIRDGKPITMQTLGTLRKFLAE